MKSGQLPAEELITRGIEDLLAQRTTIPALLVAIGTPKLRRLGMDIPVSAYDYPEHVLYDLLASEDSNSAHSKYNALVNRLVSFERALACVKK